MYFLHFIRFLSLITSQENLETFRNFQHKYIKKLKMNFWRQHRHQANGHSPVIHLVLRRDGCTDGHWWHGITLVVSSIDLAGSDLTAIFDVEDYDWVVTVDMALTHCWWGKNDWLARHAYVALWCGICRRGWLTCPVGLAVHMTNFDWLAWFGFVGLSLRSRMGQTGYA